MRRLEGNSGRKLRGSQRIAEENEGKVKEKVREVSRMEMKRCNDA